jgi:hypothetical protein
MHIAEMAGVGSDPRDLGGCIGDAEVAEVARPLQRKMAMVVVRCALRFVAAPGPILSADRDSFQCEQLSGPRAVEYPRPPV